MAQTDSKFKRFRIVISDRRFAEASSLELALFHALFEEYRSGDFKYATLWKNPAESATIIEGQATSQMLTVLQAFARGDDLFKAVALSRQREGGEEWKSDDSSVPSVET